MDMVRLKRLLSHVEDAARAERSGGIALITPALTAEELNYLYGRIKVLMEGRKHYSVGWDELGNGHRIVVKFPAKRRPAPGQLTLDLFDPPPSKYRDRSRLRRAPGSRLDALARFLVRKRTYDVVLKPYLAEMQGEYFEALHQGQHRKAQWIRIRGVACFWSTVAFLLPVSITRMANKLWTISGG